jgi:long-chain acyl-CoA synthetase
MSTLDVETIRQRTQEPRPALPVPFRNLSDMVDRTAEKYSKQHAFTAVLPNGMFGNLSFEQVRRLSDQFAVFLREVLGLAAGDRVAVQMPNSLAYPICAFGVFKAGCVLVNTNPLYTPAEMTHQLKDSGAKALVIVDLFGDKVEPVLQATGLKHVVMVRLTDLFPRIPGAIAYGVIKYWNRLVPECKAPFTPFREALELGAARLAQADLASYTADADPDTIAALQYTGGTTGVSKGAMLTHRNLLANMLQMDDHVRDHVEYGKECALGVLPLYHIFAFTVNLLYFYYAGARNILVANPRPLSNLQRAVENYPITWIPGVNTLFNGLLNEEWFADYPPPKLRGSLAGGTSLHTSVAERWRKITGTPVIEGYGLTESSPVVTVNPFTAPRDGSIGKPVLGTEVRLLNALGEEAAPDESGELAARGPQVMKGYWQRPTETEQVLTADGWLLTGDIAARDPDGYLRIVDRKKDLILVSGFNVYPNEVEECIAAMPDVSEVAVIGLPDAKTGEMVKAYVVARQGSSVTPEQVRAHCKGLLTGYKVPKEIEIRAELPKSPVGKVLRRELRAEAQGQKQERSVGGSNG